jgi:hypothetical protein
VNGAQDQGLAGVCHSPLLGRPGGVTALAIFFAVGATVSLVTIFALLLPGGVLEPIWRLNPRARTPV